MSVKITSINFQDDYTGKQSGNGSDTGVPYLMGCVGDFMYAIIDFNVSWSSLSIAATFSATNKTITRKDCGSGSFIQDGFQVGDTIVIMGSGSNDGTYTISSLTDFVITVVETLIDEAAVGVNIYGANTVTALDFYYNLASPSNERRQPLAGAFGPGHPARTANNFNSLTDTNAVQRFTGTVGTSYYYYYAQENFLYPNSTSWAWFTQRVDGVMCNPAVEFLGTTADYKQKFRMVFPFLITPLFLANQLQILKNSLAQSSGTKLNSQGFDFPDYFTDQSLGFIYKIDAKFSITSPNPDHSSYPNVDFNDGNTSWFNQFFPTAVNSGGTLINKVQYEFFSISYKDQLGNDLAAIDYNGITTVSIKIKNSTLGLDNGKYVLNFCYLPTNQALYQNYSEKNQATFREVFLHDRVKTTIAHASVDGDNYGTSTQAIQGVTSSISGGNTMKIDFKINFGSLTKSTFADANNTKNYLIWITPQKAAVTSLKTTNRSAIICDVNQAFTDTDDSSILTVITDGTTDEHFYKTPDGSGTAYTDFKGSVGDFGLAKLQFLIKSGYIIDYINTSFEVWVQDAVTTAVIGKFPVQQWNNVTDKFWDGKINQIDISQGNGFLLSSDDLRNNKSIKRKSSLDSGGQFAYEILYGFQLGYQFWQIVSDFEKSFLRYHTQYWAAYTQGYAEDGTVKIIPSTVTTKIKKKIAVGTISATTSAVTEFIHYSDIAAYDAYTNPAGNPPNIQSIVTTQDINGNDLSGSVLSGGPTVISIEFNNDAGQFYGTGCMAVYYETNNGSFFDMISSDGSGSSGNSTLWNSLFISNGTSKATLIGTIDLSSVQIQTIRLYSQIKFTNP